MAYAKRKNRARGRKRGGLNKLEVKQVKSLMHSTKEDKQVSTNSGLILHNSNISQGDLRRVIPSMTQGTAEGQRVGNEVTMKALTLKGLLNIRFNGAFTRSRIGVRVFVFSVKGYADGSAAIANASQWLGGMMRDGTNVRPFDGDVRSYFLPVNRDLITLHGERRCNITFPGLWNTGLSPDATTVPVQTQFSYKYWKMSVKCKNKRLKFSSITTGGGIDTVPNNFGPLIAVGYCKLDGSAPDLLDTGVSSEWNAQMYYEDA